MLNNPKWLNYRLADIFRGYCHKTKQLRYLASVERALPNSIAGQYISRTRHLDGENQDKNFEVLEEILREKFPEVPPPESNEIVLHLRIGDVIVGFQNGEVVRTKPKYGIPIQKLRAVLGRIERTDDDVISIVYGAHKTNFNERANARYLDAVRALLTECGFAFHEKYTSFPDTDLLYMCRSSRFIQSGGGFSVLARQLVVRFGGKVCT